MQRTLFLCFIFLKNKFTNLLEVDICVHLHHFGDDRKQAGKRSDMKHCLFLGVFLVTRNSQKGSVVFLWRCTWVCTGVFWSQVHVSDLL